MSPIHRDDADMMSPEALDRYGNKSSLTSMRQQYAQRVQQRLQDPRLRAEKALQVPQAVPHAVPQRAAHPGQRKMVRSNTPAAAPMPSSRQPCRSASVSSQASRCRPQSAGPIRRVGSTVRQEASADLLRQQRSPSVSAVRPAVGASRNSEKQMSRPLSARSVGASSRVVAAEASKRTTSVERSRVPRNVVEGQNMVERPLSSRDVAGNSQRSPVPQNRVAMPSPNKFPEVISLDTAMPSPLGVPAADAVVNSLSKLMSPPGRSTTSDTAAALTGDAPAQSSSAAQHYCIADAQAPPIAPEQHARQFSEVAKSLENAAKALREMSKTTGGGPVGFGSAASYFKESQQLLGSPFSGPAVSPKPGRRGASPVGRCCPISTPPSTLRSACPSTPRGGSRRTVQRTPQRTGSASERGASTPRQPRASPCEKRPEAVPAPSSSERLSQENASLRCALGDAVRRLVELEGEQDQFMSEGAFDLVNSLCRNPAIGPLVGSVGTTQSELTAVMSPSLESAHSWPPVVCTSLESTEAQPFESTLQNTSSSPSWVYSGVGVGGA